MRAKAPVVFVVKPEGMKNLAIIRRMLLATCNHNGLVIRQAGPARFSYEDGLEFYAGQKEWVQKEMAAQLSSRELWVAIIEGGQGARTVLRRLRGPTDPSKAHWLKPGSISGLFGVGNMRELGEQKMVIDNGAHCSTGAKEGEREAAVAHRALRRARG